MKNKLDQPKRIIKLVNSFDDDTERLARRVIGSLVLIMLFYAFVGTFLKMAFFE